jgi:pyruvate dehydrogenase E1 component alpha subunit
MSPETVYEAISKAAAHIRSGAGPYYLEIKTYRYKGHSVSDPGSYRTRDELKSYQDIDPIKVTEDKIMSLGYATEGEIEAIKERIRQEIDEAEAFAEASPYPDAAELYTDNYAEPNYPFMKD